MLTFMNITKQRKLRRSRSAGLNEKGRDSGRQDYQSTLLLHCRVHVPFSPSGDQ